MTERIRASQAAAQHRLEQQNAATAAAAAEKKAAAAAQRGAQLQAELQVPISLALIPAQFRPHIMMKRVMITALFLGRLDVLVALAAEASQCQSYRGRHM